MDQKITGIYNAHKACRADFGGKTLKDAVGAKIKALRSGRGKKAFSPKERATLRNKNLDLEASIEAGDEMAALIAASEITNMDRDGFVHYAAEEQAKLDSVPEDDDRKFLGYITQERDRFNRHFNYQQPGRRE